MAFTESSQVGIKPYRKITEGESILVPGDPAITVVHNSMLALSAGVAINATDSLAAPHMTCQRSGTVAAATQAFPISSEYARHAYTDAMKCFIPVVPGVAQGAQVWSAKIDGYQDETVVTYSASSKYIQCTTGFGADDRPNGALVYVYEGPGAGEINIVEDYDHTGGNAALELILHRPFKATLTTSSKFIVLSATAGANAVGPFGRVDLQDVDEVEVDDGADDGDFCVWPDWTDIMHLLPSGLLPIIRVGQLY